MPDHWRERLLGVGRGLLAGARDLVYPACCLLCGDPLPEGRPHFCPACQEGLFTDLHPNCPRCAGTVGPYAVRERRCPACREEAFSFEQAIRLGPYDGLLREVILRVKHQRGEGLAELLGELWAGRAAARFAALRIDVIVPVPLHWLRRWQRGYNQSAALSRGLSATLGVPCQPSGLRRVRHTSLQPNQSPAGRKANVRGAFRARAEPALRGRSVLLVDDVMTTGATADVAAGALIRAGAARVVVAVLARAQG
jgi:ComF family protein